jgi:hypothetical protein
MITLVKGVLIVFQLVHGKRNDLSGSSKHQDAGGQLHPVAHFARFKDGWIRAEEQAEQRDRARRRRELDRRPD